MSQKRLPDIGSGGWPTLRTRFVAWWEGYDLSGLKRPAPSAGEDGTAAADRSADRPSSPVQARMSQVTRTGKPLWTATRIEVAEKIWGEGFVTPGGSDYIPDLVKPLGLTPAMSVLDLSAGLGGAGRTMAAAYGTYVTGLEASPLLAEEGMQRSLKAGMERQAPVEPYEPEEFKPSKRFDCIFAKESFFCIKNKERLLDGIQEALKSRGQFLFTDYIVDPKVRAGAQLQAWYDHEPIEPRPWHLPEVVNALRQRNFDIRISEDVTELHRSQILVAIGALTDHLARHTLDGETKAAVVEEVELWARRIAALDSGLKVYRFYALKPSDGMT